MTTYGHPRYMLSLEENWKPNNRITIAETQSKKAPKYAHPGFPSQAIYFSKLPCTQTAINNNILTRHIA